MSKFRTILTAAALVLLTAVSLAAAVRTFMLGIPESPNPDRSPLVNLLATRDVRDQPLRSQRGVAHQLERELRRGTDWLDEVEQLDDTQRAMFTANVAELIKVTFLEKAEIYARLQNDRAKTQYLDRQIDSLMIWASVLGDNPQRDKWPTLGPASLIVIFGKFSQLHQQADRQQQKQIAAFQTAVQKRFVTRMQRPMRMDQGW